MWTLILQGWIIASIFVLILTPIIITNVHSFLAVTSPINANILVVEGWLADEALKQALIEFEMGSYNYLITTGIPLQRGYYLSEYKDFANLAASTLIAMGADSKKIIPIPTPDVRTDRTYASAIALKEKLENSEVKLESLNLFSDDVHTRRSWMLYKRVLPNIEIGVIAATTRSYDTQRWWNSSQGLRTVITEAIAYIYALFKSY
ncbi:MAG: YdcF family protein [Calothrix sp. C42_A2020_038]|nr:YdcF family protein [Calothrix sp. C42_A2020_038]